VTGKHEGWHLQVFYGVDHRSVTPEVAGSSPVAPASRCPADAGDLLDPYSGRLFIAEPGDGPGQRLMIDRHPQMLDLVVGVLLVL
jgi:hypothetical protein